MRDTQPLQTPGHSIPTPIYTTTHSLHEEQYLEDFELL